MPARTVVFTAHHEDIIDALVNSGRYESTSDVVREGLRLIEEREARTAAKLMALREAAQIGFADLDEGRYRDLDDDALEDFVADLGQHAANRVRAASQ